MVQALKQEQAVTQEQGQLLEQAWEQELVLVQALPSREQEQAPVLV